MQKLEADAITVDNRTWRISLPKGHFITLSPAADLVMTQSIWRNGMLNKNVIDEINAKVSDILQNSPAKDIERNIKVLLSGAFTRLDLVTRDEFDVQQEVLQRTREKLMILEGRIATLEAQLNPHPASSASVAQTPSYSSHSKQDSEDIHEK